MARGTISLGEWLAAREPLQDRLAAAKAAAGTTRRPSAAAKLLGRPGAVREAWPALDHQSRREILDAVLARVVVGPANRGRWTPTAERVTLEWCV
ncbi:MAG: hypothetical protein M5U14_07085 [Acidimicrobiia bacterium]|nr:hypothetical protein [Acidimicrobiia bacterium]